MFDSWVSTLLNGYMEITLLVMSVVAVMEEFWSFEVGTEEKIGLVTLGFLLFT